jgi:hypothetical protein
MKIDLAELASSEGFQKAMKDVPLPLLASAAILAVNLIAYLFFIPDLEDGIAAAEAKISTLRSEASSLDGKMGELRGNLSRLPKVVSDYRWYLERGYFEPEDRLKANDILNGLKDERGLYEYSLEIPAQETMSIPTAGKTVTWPASKVTVKALSYYDRPAFGFIQMTTQSLPGRTLLWKLRLERPFKKPLAEADYAKIKKRDVGQYFSLEQTNVWVTYPPEALQPAKGKAP